jgi:hypothetical protein
MLLQEKTSWEVHAHHLALSATVSGATCLAPAAGNAQSWGEVGHSAGGYLIPVLKAIPIGGNVSIAAANESMMVDYFQFSSCFKWGYDTFDFLTGGAQGMWCFCSCHCHAVMFTIT